MSIINYSYESFDYSTPEKILQRAKELEGKTFQDVLDMGIVPEGVEREYDQRRYKGGMGTLIEERFFGYKANSDQEADFAEAGVELKTTCYDVKQNEDYSAGERLVLTMVPFNCEIEDDFYDSHAWKKCKKIMLVYYERNKQINPYEQIIRYAYLFTPPEEDLKIIEDDYNTIVSIVKAGKAEELSESLTLYLGACTKGASEAKMWVNQFYPPHTPAKKRAFCFKRQYMDYVLHHYVMNKARSEERIVRDVSEIEEMTFDELILSTIMEHRGRSAIELCEMMGIPFTGNKAQYTTIVYRLLGIRNNRAEEFVKANISVRVVRVEANDSIVESMSLAPFKVEELIEEEWEDSALRSYFEETRFFFVSFRHVGDDYILENARFWAMPQADIEGPLHDCWQHTVDTFERGVHLEVVPWGDKERVENDLPKASDGGIAHVRPHTTKSWYRFADGTTRGENPCHGDILPDGRMMTKQSFWLNNSYVYEIVKLDE